MQYHNFISNDYDYDPILLFLSNCIYFGDFSVQADNDDNVPTEIIVNTDDNVTTEVICYTVDHVTPEVIDNPDERQHPKIPDQERQEVVDVEVTISVSVTVQSIVMN